MTRAVVTENAGASIAVSSPNVLQIAQESVPPGEATRIAALHARLREELVGDHHAGQMRRDVHVKMHGS